jgi:hypothetical protein
VATPDWRATRDATEGLFFFRVGDIDLGRRRYEHAIDAFARLRNREGMAHAAIMLAREELLVGSERADAAWKRALELSHNSKDAGVTSMLERVRSLRGSVAPRAATPVKGAVKRAFEVLSGDLQESLR